MLTNIGYLRAVTALFIVNHSDYVFHSYDSENDTQIYTNGQECVAVTFDELGNYNTLY